jgi:ceramide glucosyltransferase
MYAGLVSHCLLTYPGEVELLFGVSSLEDPAVAEIARLRVEFSQREIRVVECPQVLGANGKVSNLAQMLGEARYEHVVVNDSDIRVAPRYLERVMEPFASSSNAQPVGLVTLLYVGRAVGGLWSKLEALGISTEFMVGVLTARMLEGGVRFGLGSTLATTKTALAKIGGFEALVDELADDYELGSRLAKAGYRVRWLLLVPVRDCFGLFFWAWSYASDEVVWRGQRFRLKNGRLQSVVRSN